MNRIFILSLLVMLGSCTEITSGVYHNDDIDFETQDRIDQLNSKLIEGLNKGDAASVESLLSEEIKKDSVNIEQFVTHLEEILSGKSYRVIDHFHVVNNGSNEKVAIVSATDSSRSYTIQYQANTKESFVSIIEPMIDGDKYRILAVHGKFDDDWRVNILQYGRHTIANLDAIAHYGLAQEFKQKGYLTKAINHMVLASAISTPAPGFFSYKLQPEMDDFHDALMDQALNTYPMPMTIDQITTRPEIFKIMPQRVEDHVCTMIKYKSSINIDDTIALKAENDVLHAIIPELFEGIGKDVPYVFYRAYNEIPKTDVSVPYYGFVKPSITPDLSPSR